MCDKFNFGDQVAVRILAKRLTENSKARILQAN